MKERNSEGSAAVERMKKFISEHLHEHITASDVAKAAGYSQYHAARVFKAETGQSPFEYIRQQRLTASAAWDVLTEIKEALYEPVGVWLPEYMRPAGTGVYAHGVEVAEDFSGEIPEGFEVMELPACQMMVFQGEPYDDEVFEEAVGMCMEQIKRFNPEVYGYEWALELAPRMQLAPEGWRGYIEMLPVRKIS